jgi:hypothetical protein
MKPNNLPPATIRWLLTGCATVCHPSDPPLQKEVRHTTHSVLEDLGTAYSLTKKVDGMSAATS